MKTKGKTAGGEGDDRRDRKLEENNCEQESGD